MLRPENQMEIVSDACHAPKVALCPSAKCAGFVPGVAPVRDQRAARQRRRSGGGVQRVHHVGSRHRRRSDTAVGRAVGQVDRAVGSRDRALLLCDGLLGQAAPSGAVASTMAFRRRRSLRLARRIAPAMSGATTREKPAGSPWLRSVMRVPPPGASSQV